jgi:hypothetical protein
MLLSATVSQLPPDPLNDYKIAFFRRLSCLFLTCELNYVTQLVSHLCFSCMLMSRLLGAFLTLDWSGLYLSARTK